MTNRILLNIQRLEKKATLKAWARLSLKRMMTLMTHLMKMATMKLNPFLAHRLDIGNLALALLSRVLQGMYGVKL